MLFMTLGQAEGYLNSFGILVGRPTLHPCHYWGGAVPTESLSFFLTPAWLIKAICQMYTMYFSLKSIPDGSVLAIFMAKLEKANPVSKLPLLLSSFLAGLRALFSIKLG